MSMSSKYMPLRLWSTRWGLRSFRLGVLTVLPPEWLLPSLLEWDGRILLHGGSRAPPSPFIMSSHLNFFRAWAFCCSTGELITSVLWPFPRVPRELSVSIRFSNSLAREWVVLLCLSDGELKWANSLGMWGIVREVESGIAAVSEQVRLEQSESSVLRPRWPLPPLLSLCKEETSGSLRSVRTLSLLVVVLRGTPSLESSPSLWFPSRLSMSCNLDQRRLLHSKVHLSLIANRSSSSESSLWEKKDYVTLIILADITATAAI